METDPWPPSYRSPPVYFLPQRRAGGWVWCPLVAQGAAGRWGKCVPAQEPGTQRKLDGGKAWQPGTHPCPATFRTRLPRRDPRLFPLARSPFLHASRLPPALAFGFHGIPAAALATVEARPRRPRPRPAAPAESHAQAQWPASREGALATPDPEVILLVTGRSGPRIAGAFWQKHWAVSMQRLLLPPLKAFMGSRNVGLLVPRVASRTQVPTRAGSDHGSRAGIKKKKKKTRIE